MSRSWTDSFAGARRSGFSGGLEIGRDVVRYVEIESKAGRSRVCSMSSARIDVPLFEAEPTAANGKAIADAVARVAGTTRNRYLPLHVCVPDPLVRTAIFELEELPKNADARKALAKFRLQRDLPSQECEYRTEALGALNNGKQLLLGMAMSSAWCRAVIEALQTQGIVAWSLTGRLTRLLNALSGNLTGTNGVLICGMDDSWALAAFDSQGRLRYVRSQWSTASLTPAAIAAEAQRAILAYVHQDANRSVEKICLFTPGGQVDLATEINARLDEPCHSLTPAEFAVDQPDGQPLLEYSAALAAALQ